MGTASTSGSSSSSSTGGGPVDHDCSAPTGAVAGLTLTTVATSLNAPVLIKAAPGNPDRLYIVQQGGQIRILENGNVLPTPFLNISSLLQSGGEEGLLGLAFHPGYAQNGRFFVHYSASGGGESTIREFARSADPLVATPTPGQIVMTSPTLESNHNGGSIEFGDDGYLYIALGDGGEQNDPECDAQNTANLLGKISRIDVNGTPTASGYPAAPGNPNGAKYYHTGFRNPWRMSFDLCTGDLYIGDVGQGSWEEVDVAPGSPNMARNMGWPYREGAHNHNNSNCPPNPGGLNEPIAEYDHNGNCSITGGYVYRGSKIPWLRGAYLYGDYCSSRVWMVRYNGGTPSQAEIVGDISEEVGNISGFGQDGHGEVYIVVHNGSVVRIDPMP